MWQDTARRQHGAITRQQLDALGLTDAQIVSLRRRGDLIPDPRQRGLWRAASAPTTTLTEAWSAVLATNAVLSHESAASVHGIENVRDDRLHVTVPDRTHIRLPPGVRVHRVPLPPSDIVDHRGLAVTSIHRTVIECLRTGTMRRGRLLLDRSIQRGWLSLEHLDGELADFPGRWGSAKLKLLRNECAMGDAESERRLHRLLRSAGITGWAANASVDLGFARLAFDVVFSKLRLILEVDGWGSHSDVERFQTDRTRQNAAVECGWRVLRFTWFDIVERPYYVLQRVRRAVAQGQ